MSLVYVAQKEKDVKTQLMNNILRFTTVHYLDVTEISPAIHNNIIELAKIAVDSDTRICKTEFAMLMMKFICSKWIKNHVTYIETKVSKMLDFEFSRHVTIEQKSPFVDMIVRFKSLKDLIQGSELAKMTEMLD